MMPYNRSRLVTWAAIDETAQDGLPLVVAEPGQFFEDFGHAHTPSLHDA
jgi:hypothetical protein